MIKQILGRFPKKPSKDKDPIGRPSPSVSNPPFGHRGAERGSNLNGQTPVISSYGLSYGAGSHPGNGNSRANGNPASLTFEVLPSFKDVPNAEKHNLFVRKLNLCCVTFDFSDPTKSVKEKEVKRQTLLELVDYVDRKSVV